MNEIIIKLWSHFSLLMIIVKCISFATTSVVDQNHHHQYSWKSWGLVISGAPFLWWFPAPVPPPPFCASGALKLVWRLSSDPNPRRLFVSSEFLEKTSLKFCVYVFLWCDWFDRSFALPFSLPQHSRSKGDRSNQCVRVVMVVGELLACGFSVSTTTCSLYNSRA